MKITESTIRTIIVLKSNGLSNREVAKIAGCSAVTVSKYWNIHLEEKRHEATAEPDDDLAEAASEPLEASEPSAPCYTIQIERPSETPQQKSVIARCGPTYRPVTVVGDKAFVPLANRDEVAIIDSRHALAAGHHDWHLSSGYPATNINVDGKRTILLLHRFVYELEYGGLPAKPLELDHDDRDKLNSLIKNLNESSHGQNIRNIKRPNATGFRHVKKDRNRFESQVRIDGSLVYLGLYDTPAVASVVADVYLSGLAMIRQNNDFFLSRGLSEGNMDADERVLYNQSVRLFNLSYLEGSIWAIRAMNLIREKLAEPAAQ